MPINSGGFRAARRTLVIWVTGLLLASALVVMVLASLGTPRSTSKQQAQHVIPAVLALRDAALAVTNSQASFLTALQTQNPVQRASAISAAQVYGQSSNTSWTTYLSVSLNLPGEAELRQEYQSSNGLGQKLGAELVSLSPSAPSYAPTLRAQRAASDSENAALTKLQSTIYDPLLRTGSGAVTSGLRRTRALLLDGFGLLGILYSLLAFKLMREARRDQRALTLEAAQLRTGREQAEFDASLQRALEMSPTEESTFSAIRKALAIVAADTPAEVLLADSSQAHLRQVISTHPGSGAACQVGSPKDCPAARNGRTQLFDNHRLDSCRFLDDQAEHVLAICSPVNIAGRAIGVIHAQQLTTTCTPERLQVDLEVIARKAGERLSALRVLARTETQARTDSLTGLPNRRTLDAKTYELVASDTGFIVGYADLDHFKNINDTYGHDTGDRALRVFARVLRDSLRPQDLVGRHGGEEFLFVLPGCSLDDARAVSERIRSELGKALTEAAVPSFTVTIGLAESESGDTFADVLARADLTMLRAKGLGRDRVLALRDMVSDNGLSRAVAATELAKTPS